MHTLSIWGVHFPFHSEVQKMNTTYQQISTEIIFNDTLINKFLRNAPMHGQTQAFWSANKRNGREAVENRTA